MSVRIIATGGTFEKEYNELIGRLTFKSKMLPSIIDRARCTLDIELEQLMMIDSLDMTIEDRIQILKSCQNSPEKRILITHGTDTMVKTASFLASSNIPKTIIITGAMIPYSVGGSDAFFNLGNALAFAQSNSHGVYIVMNGQCWEWDKVRKNKETGYFVEV